LLEAVDARSQAVRIRDLTGSDTAVIVVPHVEAAMPDAGIIALSELGSFLKDLPASPRRREEATRPEPAATEPEKIVFASMPFRPQYEDVYWFAMTAAAQAIGATCVRVDCEDFDGDIALKIATDIEPSVAVIVDLSESNPDVLYEAGYARRHGTPCVQICSTPLQELPFNVRNVNTIHYRLGQIHALRDPMIRRLTAILD
jgi:hypothetical protein